MAFTEASVEIWDRCVLTKIRSGTEEDALPVVFLSPMGQKANVCVHAEGLRAASSCPEPSSTPCPVFLELSVSLLEINLAWGDGENKWAES